MWFLYFFGRWVFIAPADLKRQRQQLDNDDDDCTTSFYLHWVRVCLFADKYEAWRRKYYEPHTRGTPGTSQNTHNSDLHWVNRQGYSFPWLLLLYFLLNLYSIVAATIKSFSIIFTLINKSNS